MTDKTPEVRTAVHNGHVIPVGKSFTLEQIAERSFENEMTSPYDGANLELHGKNNLEAVIANLSRDAANGDPGARRELLDRILGKPLQRADVHQTSLTLVGFLDQIIAEEGANEHPITIDADGRSAEENGDFPALT